MFSHSLLMIATPPIKLSWHVIFRHDEYEKKSVCFSTNVVITYSLSLHSHSRDTRFHWDLHKFVTEEVTKFTLKLLCMTLLQDSSLLVGVDS